MTDSIGDSLDLRCQILAKHNNYYQMNNIAFADHMINDLKINTKISEAKMKIESIKTIFSKDILLESANSLLKKKDFKFLRKIKNRFRRDIRKYTEQAEFNNNSNILEHKNAKNNILKIFSDTKSQSQEKAFKNKIFENKNAETACSLPQQKALESLEERNSFVRPSCSIEKNKNKNKVLKVNREFPKIQKFLQKYNMKNSLSPERENSFIKNQLSSPLKTFFNPPKVVNKPNFSKFSSTFYKEKNSFNFNNLSTLVDTNDSLCSERSPLRKTLRNFTLNSTNSNSTSLLIRSECKRTEKDFNNFYNSIQTSMTIFNKKFSSSKPKKMEFLEIKKVLGDFKQIKGNIACSPPLRNEGEYFSLESKIVMNKYDLLNKLSEKNSYEDKENLLILFGLKKVNNTRNIQQVKDFAFSSSVEKTKKIKDMMEDIKYKKRNSENKKVKNKTKIEIYVYLLRVKVQL
jgi:hypothetical protein